MGRRAPATLALLLAACFAAGCGAAPAALTGPQHDVPVPPGEPRADLALRVDLAPAQQCEEQFDLALYEHLGVDLVQWDGRAGTCAARQVTIRYLPRRIGRDELLATVRKLATRVEPLRSPSPKE